MYSRPFASPVPTAFGLSEILWVSGGKACDILMAPHAARDHVHGPLLQTASNPPGLIDHCFLPCRIASLTTSVSRSDCGFGYIIYDKIDKRLGPAAIGRGTLRGTMRPIFGVVADDLTGGMETAAMLVAEGVACGFVTRPDRIADVDDNQAIVVAQKTRVVEAAQAVRSRLPQREGFSRRHAADLLQILCDLRFNRSGQYRTVADAPMSLTDARVTAYCPTSYELARSVFNGHLFVGRSSFPNCRSAPIR